jgi:hypothetical protein
MIKVVLILSALTAILLAGSTVTRDANLLDYDKSSFEYDAANGWWWYKDKAVDSKTGKEVEIKEKMSTIEKIKVEKEAKVEKLLQMQIAKLEAIKSRLDYAYPNITPLKMKDENGKECVTNSSASCFYFPIQPEAQHVPVIAAWLSDPSPTNSREWLKWEAKYFNHLQQVSIGNRFAFLSGGPNAYPTDTTSVYDESLITPVSGKNKIERQNQVIANSSKKIGLMFFLGGNLEIEESLSAYSQLREYDIKPWKDLNMVFVVPSKEIKSLILKKIERTNDREVQAFWKKATWKISPEAFTNFDISVTPSVIATYKTDKEKIIWQNVYSGSTNVNSVRMGLIQFLVYNNIIKPVEMSASINNASVQKNMQVEKPVFNETGIYEDSNTIKR